MVDSGERCGGPENKKTFKRVGGDEQKVSRKSVKRISRENTYCLYCYFIS